MEFGQISSGCEVVISPKEWDRSVAQLPSLPPLSLQHQSQIATAKEEEMVMDMDKRQSLFGSFVNYFKATEEKIPQKVNNSSNLYVESFDMRKRHGISID